MLHATRSPIPARDALGQGVTNLGRYGPGAIMTPRRGFVAKKIAGDTCQKPLSTPQRSRLCVATAINNKEAKTPVKSPMRTPAKKAPDFAKIHQKIFNKMESLVDAKARVAKRHENLTKIPSELSKGKNKVLASTPVPQKTGVSEAAPAEYNKYGFRLRKNEAVKVLMQRQPLDSSVQIRAAKRRAVLNESRTERRSSLTMEARRIGQMPH